MSLFRVGCRVEGGRIVLSRTWVLGLVIGRVSFGREAWFTFLCYVIVSLARVGMV